MTASGVVVEDHGVVAALLAIAAGLGDSSDTLGQIGREALAVAHPLVPVATGALAADLDYKATGDELLIRAGQVVDYAAPQNSGVPSRNIPPTHFFDAAERYVEEHAEHDVELAIDRLIHRHGL